MPLGIRPAPPWPTEAAFGALGDFEVSSRGVHCGSGGLLGLLLDSGGGGDSGFSGDSGGSTGDSGFFPNQPGDTPQPEVEDPSDSDEATAQLSMSGE